jgi:hypothetical protein
VACYWGYADSGKIKQNFIIYFDAVPGSTLFNPAV